MKTDRQISEEMREIAKAIPATQMPYLTLLQARRDINETPAQNLETQFGRSIALSSMSVSFHAVGGQPVDIAYNVLIEEAIKDNAAYALCIEEDTVVPWNGAMQLLRTAKDFPEAIVVGVYYVKFSGPMIGQKDAAGRVYASDVTPNTGVIRDVALCGLGCALIPMSVIRKIQERFPGLPLFTCVPAKCWNDADVHEIGQDSWFYNLAGLCGVEVVCDTAVQCLHMELATGKYTAHPDISCDDYITNIPLAGRLTLADRTRVTDDYISRMNKPVWTEEAK